MVLLILGNPHLELQVFKGCKGLALRVEGPGTPAWHVAKVKDWDRFNV